MLYPANSGRESSRRHARGLLPSKARIDFRRESLCGERDEFIAVSEGSEAAAPKKVLIIDDEVEIGRLIARIARSAGCAPTVVTDPAEFMKLF